MIIDDDIYLHNLKTDFAARKITENPQEAKTEGGPLSYTKDKIAYINGEGKVKIIEN